MAPEAGLGAIPAAPFGKDKGAALISGKSSIPAGQECFTPAARELPGWASLLAAGYRLPESSTGRRPALRRSARAIKSGEPCVTRAAIVGA